MHSKSSDGGFPILSNATKNKLTEPTLFHSPFDYIVVCKAIAVTWTVIKNQAFI